VIKRWVVSRESEKEIRREKAPRKKYGIPRNGKRIRFGGRGTANPQKEKGEGEISEWKKRWGLKKERLYGKKRVYECKRRIA